MLQTDKTVTDKRASDRKKWPPTTAPAAEADTSSSDASGRQHFDLWHRRSFCCCCPRMRACAKLFSGRMNIGALPLLSFRVSTNVSKGGNLRAPKVARPWKIRQPSGWSQKSIYARFLRAKSGRPIGRGSLLKIWAPD